MQRLNIATLILDDDKDILYFIEEALRANNITNYHLFQEETAFIDQIGENMHILVIDHYLDGASTGLEVMKKAILKNPKVFVITMSGTSNPETIVEYLNNGCNRFVLKDHTNYLEELISFIREGVEIFVRDVEFYRRMEKELGFSISETVY